MGPSKMTVEGADKQVIRDQISYQKLLLNNRRHADKHYHNDRVGRMACEHMSPSLCCFYRITQIAVAALCLFLVIAVVHYLQHHQ